MPPSTQAAGLAHDDQATRPTSLRTRYVIDTETCSEVDLETVGGYRYAIDPSTRILTASAQYVDPGSHLPWSPFAVWSDAGIRSMSAALSAVSHDTIIQSYGDFDYLIWKYVGCRLYGWPDPDQWEWEDLMQRAAYGNLPGALDKVAAVMGTPRKDPAGHALMLKLCKPARPIRASNDPWRLHTQENIEALGRYCLQDVAAEEPLDGVLPRLPACEVPVVRADRAMNRRGIRVDLGRVEQIKRVAAEYNDHLTTELRTITHGAVETVTKLPALRDWLLRHHVPVREGSGALDKYAIDGFLAGENYDGTPLERPLDDDVRRVLSIRRWLGKSSLAKLDALTAATSPVDQRVRGMFQYYGADRTGRWAGRIIQPQNIPKGILVGSAAYEEALWAMAEGLEALTMLYGGDDRQPDQIMDVLASLLRTCLVPTPGNRLMVIDYNAIECRVAAWFAGERWLLDCFATGRDPYRITAGRVLSKEPDAVTKQERNDSGKLPELSCQYGLGWRSFKKQAKQRGLVFSEEWSKHVVETYRETHPAIRAKWFALEDAAVSATRNPGRIYGCGQVAFRHDGVHLKLRLPVGRCVTFFKARIEMRPPPWDPDVLKPTLLYWGEDSVTHQWCEQTAWGGDFMAISCQGMARDIIADALVRTERLAGNDTLDPVLTVHDELGFDTHREDYENIVDLMCELPAWCGSLPMKAEGFCSDYYRK